jgi:hypothetical protein
VLFGRFINLSRSYPIRRSTENDGHDQGVWKSDFDAVHQALSRIAQVSSVVA